MFWKIVSRANGFLRRLSVAARLTLLYSILTSILLSVICFLLYHVLVSSLEKESTHFLAEKINILSHTLQEEPSDLEDLREEVASPAGGERLYARVLNSEEQILVETPGMTNLLPARVFKDLDSQKHQWKSREGAVYRLTLQNVGAEWELQVGIDITGDQALLASYRNRLLVVLVLGSLFAGIVGRWIAHQGMRPLRDIAIRAQEITASNLNQRIRAEDWPAELQALARELNQMLQRLEEAFGRLVNFSSELAHELRTPINNLMGETEVSLLQKRTVEEYKQVLESNLEEFKRIFRMIDNLLFLARAEDAEMILKTTLIDVGQESAAVRDFFEAVADERRVNIVCEGSAILRADPILFRRALSNLVSNSLQFTPAGGTITISVQPNGPDVVQVSVSDTGCGISSDAQSKAFERFYRSEEARSLYPQGLGLGLSIVHSIMKLHQGKVTLHS
jgi:two-component system heavy metal sensor histidine kinase CusS